MWAMLASEPVSRLSTQMTRLPRRSNSSHRWDPRNPAPPVTRQVGIRGNLQRRVRSAGLSRRAGRLLGWAGTGYPLALLPLPDWRPRLDLVDDLPSPGEGLGAVRSGHSDGHRGLRERHRPDAMLCGGGAQSVALDRLGHD